MATSRVPTVDQEMGKPPEVFDRDFEWAELTRFARYSGREATLGVVSGRRRQGKTFLLDAVTRASGGFMFTATETTEADALRQFGEALAAYREEPVPFRFAHWDDAITSLMRIAPDGPIPAVIDEFPFLAKASPALPSIIQRALDPAARATHTPVRLLLCGSALPFMGRLLSGNAPLRGQAGLELVVPTLDYRLAPEFWDIADPRVAVLTHAIVGGTPAYRREFTQGDTPSGPDDFDDWVVRAVLNPGRPLFREARYLLAEEPDLHDTALYHSVLAAIATGNTSRGGIADYLGRKSTDLAHPLHVLEDVGLIRHEPDAFRRNRSAYRIAEPLVTFYHAVMRPNWGDLERPGRAPPASGDARKPPSAPRSSARTSKTCAVHGHDGTPPRKPSADTPAVSPPAPSTTPRPRRITTSTSPYSATVTMTAKFSSPSAKPNGTTP